MNRYLIGMALGATVACQGANVVIDDFGGGPHVANLTSLAPPEIALGSFAYGGAIGGFRDAAVWSVTAGTFSAGVAFNSGGYASFVGTGKGGIVWDGVAGITDSNGDEQITGEELDYGLNLDLSDCLDGSIEITAFADLENASLDILLATDAGNFNRYTVALTGPVGSFNPYSVDLSSPTATTGALDFGDIGAVALFIDGTGFANLDVLVSKLEISCPDAGSSLGLLALGLIGLPFLRRRHS